MKKFKNGVCRFGHVMTQRDAHLEYYDVQRQFKEKTSVAELEAIFVCGRAGAETLIQKKG